MNISTLAKILGVSIKELRDTGNKEGLKGFSGRNTRIPYQSALEITKVLRPEKVEKLQDDDKIYIAHSLTVAELAEAIGRPPGVVMKTLVLNGVMVTLNESIDFDTAALVSSELGIEVHPENPEMMDQGPKELEDIETFSNEGDGKIVERAPVVTVMGHVDHGKTTLLDTIRRANVAGGEAGAITQHISSYQIEYNDKKITFVDTPGHEAFTAMRVRGTQLADFVILVVAATEGPKPQTVEVIERAKITKTPVIVAINKIDLPEADAEKVKGDIAAFGLVPEEWGGDVPFLEISAKNNLGIEKVLDTILLMADVAELKGQVDCAGQGVVIESHLDNKKGVVATVLVTRDKIEVGDFVACGIVSGKIRTIIDSAEKIKQKSELGEPVEITGLSDVVDTGELLKVYDSKKAVQNAINTEKVKRSQKKIYYSKKTTDDSEVKVVLKADVAGSLEALKEAILKIPQEHAKVSIIAESVGQVSESDVEFAETTNSTILAFHTNIIPNAQNALEKKEVGLMKSDIIYEILEWVEGELLKHIKHEVKTVKLGEAEVLALFKGDKPDIQVLGAEVKEGKILDNKELKVIRRGTEMGRLEIIELQRNKVKSKEVNISQQFGLSVKGKVKVQVGDILESIDEVVIK